MQTSAVHFTPGRVVCCFGADRNPVEVGIVAFSSSCACRSDRFHKAHIRTILIERDTDARFPGSGHVQPPVHLVSKRRANNVRDSVHSEDQVVIIIATQLDRTAIGEETFIGLVVQRINVEPCFHGERLSEVIELGGVTHEPANSPEGDALIAHNARRSFIGGLRMEFLSINFA